jgi:hypothetical protein
MGMIAKAIENQNNWMMQEKGNMASGDENLYKRIQKSNALNNRVKIDVDKLNNLTQRRGYTVWINDFFRILCNTVDGFDRPWTYVSNLLKFG